MLVPADYTSAQFLKRWNSETIADIRHEPTESSLYKGLFIENLQSDSLGFHAATRGKFLSTLRDNQILPDSLRYNNIYIIETEHEGEYTYYNKLLVIDGQPNDYFYRFKSVLGEWKLVSQGKGDFSFVQGLCDYLLTNRNGDSKNSSNTGPVAITKVNPDTLLTGSIFNPTVEQMDSISNVAMLLVQNEK